MKTGHNRPRLFNEVIEAIASLKESHGSTKDKIMDQVENILSRRITRLKNDKTQIHRALKHGLTTGLIKAKNGKYVLGMNKKDYGAFKKLKMLGSMGDMLMQSRRRGGRRRRRRSRSRRSRKGRRGRRGRRRGGKTRKRSDLSESEDGSEFDDEDDIDDDSSVESIKSGEGSGSLEDRARRRRRRRRRGRGGRKGGKRGKRRRRRGRRGIRKSSTGGIVDIHHHATSENKFEVSSKSSDEEFKIKRDSDTSPHEHNPDMIQINNDDEPMDGGHLKCEKENCLCNSHNDH
ncbi:unnamed protein product [Diabrotica balteata]|uniref:H15 domain-containing protein n=1 Tax=Diabrotica balteata TaxID=107213 RepID=A0A9N9X654_DIABA|nr:unnamed protein product [Diabrotica balteata]